VRDVWKMADADFRVGETKRYRHKQQRDREQRLENFHSVAVDLDDGSA
jgi:hypothetical protein